MRNAKARTPNWLNVSQVAEYIDQRFQSLLMDIRIHRAKATLITFGLSCTGKTYHSSELQRTWTELDPTVVPHKYWILNRHERLAKKLSDASVGAFCLGSMLNAFQDLSAAKSVNVDDYDRENGAPILKKVLLRPSNLIYLQGAGWYYLRNHIEFDKIILTIPSDNMEWREAFIGQWSSGLRKD